MKNVVIVGVGALGSHAAQFLRSAGAQLRVIDFDRVEQKNVLSQFHGKPSIGKLKSTSLQQAMAYFYGLKIEAVSNKLVQDNVSALLGKADLVIDCLDNGESRRVVQKFVREHSIPCLHGALAAAGSFGQVVWDEKFTIDDAPAVGAPTCEDGEHLPFIAIVSAYLAKSAQIFLSTDKKVGFQMHAGGAVRI